MHHQQNRAVAAAAIMHFAARVRNCQHMARDHTQFPLANLSGQVLLTWLYACLLFTVKAESRVRAMVELISATIFHSARQMDAVEDWADKSCGVGRFCRARSGKFAPAWESSE